MEEECRVLREKAEALEREHQTLRLELTSEIDELKLKVCRYLYTGQSLVDSDDPAICPPSLWRLSSAQLHRTELERDQLRQSLEVERAHHTEELSTIQSANE